MGEGESCGIRRFAGALTGRGFRVYYVCMYVYPRACAIPDSKNTLVETMEG